MRAARSVLGYSWSAPSYPDLRECCPRQATYFLSEVSTRFLYGVSDSTQRLSSTLGPLCKTVTLARRTKRDKQALLQFGVYPCASPFLATGAHLWLTSCGAVPATGRRAQTSAGTQRKRVPHNSTAAWRSLWTSKGAGERYRCARLLAVQGTIRTSHGQPHEKNEPAPSY